MVEIEIVDNNTAISAWDGRTYGFRGRFEEALIPRRQDNMRLLPKGMRNFDVVENSERIGNSFGNLVLRDSVCCVRVTGHVADLIKDLQTKPNLFFEAF